MAGPQSYLQSPESYQCVSKSQRKYQSTSQLRSLAIPISLAVATGIELTKLTWDGDRVTGSCGPTPSGFQRTPGSSGLCLPHRTGMHTCAFPAGTFAPSCHLRWCHTRTASKASRDTPTPFDLFLCVHTQLRPNCAGQLGGSSQPPTTSPGQESRVATSPEARKLSCCNGSLSVFNSDSSMS